MAMQTYKARVAEHSYLAKKYQYVDLELISPNKINFTAGQYVLLKVPGEVRLRQYSIVSPPVNQHGIELVVDVIPGGAGSTYLASLSPGDEVEFRGPAGAFVISGHEEEEERLWFIATGSGIAPIKAMIIDLLVTKRDKREMWLHWGLRFVEDVFWFDEFARLAEEYGNFNFDMVLSKPSEKWQLCKGHTNQCVLQHHSKFSNIGVYLCGNSKMINDMKQKLIEKGVDNRRIHYEQFYE